MNRERKHRIGHTIQEWLFRIPPILLLTSIDGIPQNASVTIDKIPVPNVGSISIDRQIAQVKLKTGEILTALDEVGTTYVNVVDNQGVCTTDDILSQKGATSYAAGLKTRRDN